MIGSPRKVKLIVDRLREGLYCRKTGREFMHLLGYYWGSDPAEIAICIMAEIIAVKHGVRHQVGGVKSEC